MQPFRLRILYLLMAKGTQNQPQVAFRGNLRKSSLNGCSKIRPLQPPVPGARFSEDSFSAKIESAADAKRRGFSHLKPIEGPAAHKTPFLKGSFPRKRESRIVEARNRFGNLSTFLRPQNRSLRPVILRLSFCHSPPLFLSFPRKRESSSHLLLSKGGAKTIRKLLFAGIFGTPR